MSELDYLFYALIGNAIGGIVGLVVSVLTGLVFLGWLIWVAAVLVPLSLFFKNNSKLMRAKGYFEKVKKE